MTRIVFYGDDGCVSRDAVATGLAIAKRRHQLNRAGQERLPGERRMRQSDLARLLETATSTVANWERGKSYPERHLGDVERVLGITLTDTGEELDPREQEIMAMQTIGPDLKRQMIEMYRRRARAEAADLRERAS